MSKTPLLDRLRAADPAPPWWIDRDRMHLWRAHRDRLLLTVRSPELAAFQIGEIAKYYYEFEARENWNLGELEGLKVPYVMAWMEHPLSRTIHSEIGDSSVDELVTGGDAGFLAVQARRDDVEGEGIPEGTKHILVLEIFMRYEPLGRAERTQGPHGAWAFALDRAGRVLGVPSMQGFQDPIHNEHMKLYQSFLWPVLLACSDLSIAGLREPAFL